MREEMTIQMQDRFEEKVVREEEDAEGRKSVLCSNPLLAKISCVALGKLTNFSKLHSPKMHDGD